MADLTTAEVTAATQCPAEHVATHWPALLDALQAAGVASRNSQAGMAATVAVETGSFRPLSERLNYSADALRRVWPSRFPTVVDAEAYARQPERIANYVYAGRMGNGDVASGDGWRYRGRGFIQLTGHDNYIACGAAIGQDLVGSPDLLLVSEVSAAAAVWFWTTRHIAAACEMADWQRVRRLVNGGLTGFADLEAILRRFGYAA